MQLSSNFTAGAKRTTPESRKATADGIEAFIGAIMIGQAQPEDMDIGLLTAAVQGLRDTAVPAPMPTNGSGASSRPFQPAAAEDWRVGLFVSSANPPNQVKVLVEGQEQIATSETREDFVGWLGDIDADQFASALRKLGFSAPAGPKDLAARLAEFVNRLTAGVIRTHAGESGDDRQGFEAYWHRTRGWNKATRELRPSLLDGGLSYMFGSTARHWTTWVAARAALTRFKQKQTSP